MSWFNHDGINISMSQLRMFLNNGQIQGASVNDIRFYLINLNDYHNVFTPNQYINKLLIQSLPQTY